MYVQQQTDFLFVHLFFYTFFFFLFLRAFGRSLHRCAIEFIHNRRFEFIYRFRCTHFASQSHCFDALLYQRQGHRWLTIKNISLLFFFLALVKHAKKRKTNTEICIFFLALLFYETKVKIFFICLLPLLMNLIYFSVIRK